MGSHAEEPQLTLAMIVKDESAVIERCLASVKPLISNWVIVDTGSTDDTCERIERALADVPGTLHRREWVDFGHNRTELMELAHGVGTHLLLVDADMTVRVEGAFVDRGNDQELLRHEGDPSYWIPRIVRSDRQWRYVGATHEYLAADGEITRGSCDAFVIEHHADGGSRGDKFERDARLLARSLERDPDDARATFYLAQTLRDLGQTSRAIELYRRRVAMGGWDEEVFYSQLQLGMLLATYDHDASVTALMRAWEMRPTRAEPLYELAKGLNSRSEFSLSLLFSERGLAIEMPDDLLFVHPDPYRWGLRFEHAIACYRTGRLDDALADNRRLLDDGVPKNVEPWVRHNLAWCERALGISDRDDHARLPLMASPELPSLEELVPSTTITELDIEVEEGWSRFNPSIVRRGDELVVNLRSSNYRIGPGGAYFGLDGRPSSIVRTTNHLVRLDRHLAVTGTQRIPSIPAAVDSSVVGLEDVRLIDVAGHLFGLAARRDASPTMVCEQALLDTGIIGDATTTLAVSAQRLDSPVPDRHEKNWMPFVIGDELYVVYSCDPCVVLHVAMDGALTPASTTPGPPSASGFRGGSQGVDLGDAHLFVVHEVLHHARGRVYAHRLVRLDHATWTIDAMSAPFHFTKVGIEFCAGLAVLDDDAFISFGVDDATAWIALCRLDQLLELLVPVLP